MKNIVIILSVLIIVLFAIFTCPVSGNSEYTITQGALSSLVSEALSANLVPKSLFETNPLEPITRAEFCEIIDFASKQWISDNNREIDINNVNFLDTQSVSIQNCLNLGIIKGYPDGTFKPDNILTRNEASVILMNTAQAFNLIKNTVVYPHRWNDSIPSWCYRQVCWCYHNGVISGTGNNKFIGQGNFTKEQAIITVLHLNQLKNGILSKNTDYFPIYCSYDIDNNFAEDGLYYLKNYAGLLDSENNFVASSSDSTNQKQLHSVVHSTQIENTILGKEVFLQYLSNFSNNVMWFEDIYGKQIYIPGVGQRFKSIDIYYTEGEDIAATFVLLENEKKHWSESGNLSVHMNLSTGEMTNGALSYKSGIPDLYMLTFFANGCGIYAIQKNGIITVYNSMASPIKIILPDGFNRFLGFCSDLLVVEHKNDIHSELMYYTPFGELVYTANRR